mmetsp:Transcript_69275/g.122592  ORF Transcript_69275/g.122592 Transcript_69275/m.122592 type:complete len:324 (-) Transcript_69275:93-1064(-)
MATTAARSFKQSAFGADSFKRQPITSALHVLAEALPDMDQLQKILSEKVCSFSADRFGEDDSTSLEAELSMARWDVKQFCQAVSATSIHPSCKELEEMWSRCAKYHPSVVVDAIYDQLAVGWSGAEKDWQPQLRALLLLEHMKRQPGAAGGAARAAVCAWQQLLVFLIAEAPQFKDVAGRLLDLPVTTHACQQRPAATQQSKIAHSHLKSASGWKYVPIPELSKVHGSTDRGFFEDDTASATSTELGRLSSLSDVECDSQPEVEQPLPTIPHAPGLEARRDPQEKRLRYLWLSFVPSVPVEKLPEPFSDVADLSDTGAGVGYL